MGSVAPKTRRRKSMNPEPERTKEKKVTLARLSAVCASVSSKQNEMHSRRWGGAMEGVGITETCALAASLGLGVRYSLLQDAARVGVLVGAEQKRNARTCWANESQGGRACTGSVMTYTKSVYASACAGLSGLGSFSKSWMPIRIFEKSSGPARVHCQTPAHHAGRCGDRARTEDCAHNRPA